MAIGELDRTALLERKVDSLERLMRDGLTRRYIRSVVTIVPVYAQGRAQTGADFLVRFFSPPDMGVSSVKLQAWMSATTEIAVSKDGSSFETLGMFSGSILLDISKLVSSSFNVVRFSSSSADVSCCIWFKGEVFR